MELTVCGARGSVATPGPATNRYGGNTSCVWVTLADGTQLVLDAGTGLRNVPVDVFAGGAPIHILLTHLHIDHIQGLLFFSPLFRADAEITLWGPSAAGASLRTRIARYLSAPLTPVDVEELSGHIDFRNCPAAEWRIGSARVRVEAVAHRGPTLGVRIEDGGRSLCYIPDHEPGLIGQLESLAPERISGWSLARGADLLLHDAQYTDGEYPAHHGWGHSAISHTLAFALRAEVGALMLFHHDPDHDDDTLDALHAEARDRWVAMGREPDTLTMAVEGGAVPVAGRFGAAATPAGSAA